MSPHKESIRNVLTTTHIQVTLLQLQTHTSRVSDDPKAIVRARPALETQLLLYRFPDDPLVFGTVFSIEFAAVNVRARFQIGFCHLSS